MLEARKKLGLVPWPTEVKLTSGEYRIPDEVVITIGSGDKDARFSASALAKALRAVGKRPKIAVPSTKSDGQWLTVRSEAAASAAKSSESLGDQGYTLSVGDGIEIAANKPAGLFYGVQTLIQAATAGQGTLPKCSIADKPSIAFRGAMADLARLKERDDYYFALIDFMAEYKFNALFLHITDDQGAPIELKKHPELTSDYPLAHKTIKKLVKYAAERHIDVIPELEAWGHAGWITGCKEHEDISEGGPDLCTMNPKTWELIADLLDELIPLFPSKYFHGGSDEAKFGICPKCAAEVKAKGAGHVVGMHLQRTAEMIHERGKIPILWSDILVQHKEPLSMVPKYTVLNHWNYRADFSDEPIRMLMQNGYKVMGGSGIVFGSRAVLPKGDALENVERFGQVTRDLKLEGINNTIWIPQRYVSDTLWYGIALAGEASWSGGKPDREGLTASFFKSYFGIDAGQDLIDAVKTLHDLSAYVGYGVTGIWSGKTEFDELAVPAAHAEKVTYTESASNVLKVMKDYRSKTMRHKYEFGALVYAAEMKAHIGKRSSAPGVLTQAVEQAKTLAGSGKASSASKILSGQAAVLTSLAEKEQQLADATEKYWDRWRYADDPKKLEPHQNTLYAMRTSDVYICKLADRLTTASADVSAGKEIDWDSLLAE